MTVTPTPTAPRLATAFDTGASNSDGVTNINTPTIVGTAAPGALVKLYDTNGALLGMATADATSGGYAISIVNLPSSDGLPDSNLDDGVHQVTVTATLPGEDTSQVSPPLLLTIDTQVPDAPTAPTLTAGSDTGASALDGITSMTTLTLTGQSEPGAQVQVLDGTTLVGQVTAASDGSYTVTTGVLDAKAHSFTAIAMDLAGNLSAPSNVTAVTIDTVAPAAPPAPTLAPGSDTGTLRTDGMTSDTTPVVVGTAEAGATVKLTDADGTVLGTAVAGSDGSYAIQSSTLLFGPNELKVTATDVAGNVSATSAPLNIVVQTQESTAMITASTDDDASAGSTTFTITFAEPIADRRGITPDDFKLVTTGTAFGTIESVSGFKLVTTGTAFGTIESVSGHGQTGTIVVDGLGGSGTVSVVLADDTQITDVAGKPIDLTSTQSHDVDGTVGGDVLPVSAGPSGVVGPGQDPSPSVGGRFVAFDSAFNNASGSTDVYVKDLVTGGLTKVTASLDGDPATRFLFPSLSGSGSVITFVSLTETNVSGQPVTFAANVYVATLTPADPDSGDSVVVGPITLVSTGNGNAGSSTTYQGFNDATADAAVVSGDGSTVAFTSDQALLAGVTAGVKNVYAYDVATGTLTLVTAGTGMDEYGYVTSTIPDPYFFGGFYKAFEPIANRPAGAGGDFASKVTSISADGTKIAFTSTATDLGGGPLPAEDLGVGGSPPLRAYVYDLTTGTKTVLDGTGVFGGLNASYQTFDPQISADGTTVTYDVQYESNSLVVFERNLVSGMVTQLTPGPTASGYGEEDSGATPSGDGSYVAYSRNSLGIIGTEDPNQIIVSTPANAANGSGDLQGYQPTLTASGSAVVFTGLLGNDTVAYEATLGVTAGIGAVGTEDEIGAVGLAAIKAAGSITFTGTTNAPVGSLVSLQVGAQGGMPGLVTTGDVTAPGMWTVVANAADLGADGTYIVAVTVKGANGASPRATRDFQLDTVAPDAPVAPKLDPGSDTGLAHDGTVTDSDTPTLTGTAEAGATVTLIDQGGRTPGMVLGTGMADGNGVYAITASALTQGAHALAVTATDEAGNVSAASEALALNVDAIVPDAPQAPQEVTISTPGAVGDPPKLSNVAVANPDGDGVITTETAPVLSGRGVPGATVTLYDTDGVSVLGTAVVGADATWSITSSTLTDGLHKLTVTQTKASGAVSVASAPLDLTVDTLPPLSPVITTLGGPIDSNAEHTSQVDVIGTAEPGSTVQLHVDMDNLVSGTATVEADGTYEIDAMVAPGTHKLTVIATDAAGNASQPSAVTLVTVEGGVPTPPSTATNLGKVTDGYVAGATVFYDANGNGVLDPGEAASLSNDAGLFQLSTSPAPIVAVGGLDTGTGYTLPGALTAPPGSTVVTPLTTFLAAYANATGQTADASLAAVDVALGLPAGTDVRLLDPIAAAAAGHSAALVASTKLMDTAVDFSAVIAGTGVSQSAAFATVFQAMAQAAMATAGPLDLSELSGFSSQPVLTSILNTAFAISNPGGTLPTAAASNALNIVGRANYDLDAYELNNGSALPAYAQALETVVQGPVATALLAAATNPGAIEAINNTGIESQISAAQQTQYLAAPRLISASDSGESDQDNVTADPSPVLTGTARPSSLVLLLTSDKYLPNTFDVVGSGYADASGAYSIAATIVGTTLLFAIEAPAGQSAAIGAHLQVDAPDAADVVTLYTPLAAAPNPVLPVIVGDNYLAASGDGPGASALKVYGTLGNSAHETGDSVVSLYVDGGTVPVGSGSGDQTFAIVTPALANGAHTLVVTQTFFDGTSQSSAPFSVTITAPTFVTTTAEAAGPLAGSDYFASGSQVFTATDQNGLAAVQAPTSSGATQSDIMFGIDTATGLRLPEPLYSPSVSAEINPLTTLEHGFPGVPNPGTFTPGLFSQALQNSRTVAALGLPADTDLATADPLALAEAGNPALLVKSVEVLETATLLSPFLEDNFDIMSYSPSAVFTSSIDFTNPATILTWLQIGQYSNFSTGFANTYAYAASVYPAVAQIIAANNAAIEADARTATSPAAIVAFLLADERLVQSIETPALEALSLDEGNPTLQPAGFATAEAADTGQNLAAAILAQQAQTAQVTSFVPAGAAATTAPTITEILTFSQPVTGLTAADFTVHGTGLQDVQVQSVAAVPGSDDTQYDVTVQTGIGAGTLTVTYKPGTVANADGSALPTGQFDAPTFYGDNTAFDTGPISVAIGDVNGDGIPDIISANTYGLTVYLGLGGGQFAAQAPIAAGGFAAGSSVLVADLNDDGKPDLVTLDTQNGTLSVLLGRGDGTFGDPTIIDAGTMPTSVVAGDFSGNGKTDLAIVDYGNGTGSTMRILLGNGDGTFTAGQVLSDGFGYDGKGKLLAVDLNGDGKLDLVGTFGSHGYLPVLLGNGDGTFTAVSGVPGFDNRGLQIAVGDLNGDGIPDVVLVQSTYVNGAYSSMGTVLLGNGDGSFRAGSTFVLPTTGLNSSLNAQVSTIALGNIDGTGKLDLVVETASGIEVLPGNGDGTFAPAYLVTPAGASATQGGVLAVGDLNGDGLADLVTAESNSSSGAVSASTGSINGIGVYLAAQQTVLAATSAPVTETRAALANPVLSEPGGAGTLTQSGTAYTLDLGTLNQGQAMQALTFALQNLAGSPADAFTGLFASPTATGFTVSGASLPGPVDAGQSYTGLSVAIDTTTLGQHTQTITFAPRDQSATTTTYATTPGTDDVTATTTSVDGANVAAELPPITLTITDTVAPSTTGVAVLQAPGAVTLANVRVGAPDQQAIAIANGAAAPAAVLDVSATATGAATVMGAVVNLAAGGTDTSDLVAGLSTAQAGAASGTIALAPASDSGSGPVALPPASVAISGKVFRTAVAQIAPVSVVLNMNAPGLLSLSVRNTAANDGYSEALVASIGSLGSGLTAAGVASTGDVAAGAASTALAVQIDTSHAGTFNTTATLTLLSDGGIGAGAIDGLGTLGLASIVVPISVTVLAPVVAPAVLQAPAALSFGNVRVGASDSQAIAITNAATVPAAVLDVTAAASGAASVTGSIANLAAGATDTADLVAGLSTAQAGAVSGSLTLAPGSDNGGGAVPLSTATVALSGKVYRTAAAQVLPVSIVVHVGDIGIAPLIIGNAAIADGYSEALAASIGSYGSGLTAAATGGSSTGDIAPGASSSVLSVGFDTSAAGKFTTTATLIDVSDGGTGPGAIDGLGTVALAPIVVPLSVEIDNDAVAAIAVTVGSVTQVANSTKTLNLGSFAQGSGPVSISLGALNQILGQADTLAGMLTSTGGLSGTLSSVSGIAAGALAAAGTLTLDTSSAGTVSDTLTFTPTSVDAAGSTALAPITLTLQATVTPTTAVTPPPTGIQPFAALQIAGGGQGVTVQAGLLQPVAGSFTNLLGGTIESDGETYEDEAAATQDQAALAGVTLLASVTPSLGLSAEISGPGVLTDTGSAFSVLTTLSPDATVVAGPGNDRLVSAAGGTLIGGPNGDVFFALAGPTSVQGGAGHDIIASFDGDTAVVTGAGGSIVAFGTGTGTFTGHAADTIFGGSGPDTIVTAANSLVGLRTGTASVSAGSGSIVIGGSGAATVSAAGTGALFFAGGGAATFIGDGSSSTVVGGAGSDSVFAGAGGGLFGAGRGGNSVLMGGTGASTLFGGASGDVLVAQGAAGTALVAGAGNESLQGAASSGNDIFYAGPGADQLSLGGGSDTVFLGTGSASVTAGAGRDVIAVTRGAGSVATLYGFKQGVDAINLEQYAPGEGVVRTVVLGSGTTITLSDGATITFAGFTATPDKLFG